MLFYRHKQKNITINEIIKYIKKANSVQKHIFHFRYILHFENDYTKSDYISETYLFQIQNCAYIFYINNYSSKTNYVNKIIPLFNYKFKDNKHNIATYSTNLLLVPNEKLKVNRFSNTDVK